MHSISLATLYFPSCYHCITDRVQTSCNTIMMTSSSAVEQQMNGMDIEEGILEPSVIHEGSQTEHDSDISEEFSFYQYDERRENSFQEHNQEDHTASAMQRQVRTDLINSIKENLLLYSGRISSPVSIYKVPSKLRKENEESYTPRLVSIGPYHHGTPELQAMERFKWRFLNKYLEKTRMSLDYLSKAAMDMEHSVRQCYQDSFDNLSSKDFSEMILLDGIFLVVLFQKIQITNEMIGREELQITSKEGEDYCNSKDSMQSTSEHVSQNLWVRSDVLHDIMLLENQIPFFVLQKFFIGRERLINDHIFDFLLEVGSMKTLRVASSSSTEPRNLVDFIRNYHRPDQQPQDGVQIEYVRTATELYEAGVKFKKRPSQFVHRGYNLFEIKFLGDGELIIPTLRIDEHTETLFRNLIAFEQCDIRARKDVTSYIILLRSFIRTHKDVDLFVNCGVIENSLGDHEQVAKLFQNLHKKAARDEKDFYFASLCYELNEYSRDYCHQWRADWFRWKRVLRHDYFSNPWSSISVIAAIILLVFSAIQAVGSVISMFQLEI